MKILVLENEFEAIRNAFAYLNKKHYNNSIEIKDLPRSQSVEDYGNLNQYQYIFVDIDLSTESKLDGFGVLEEIQKHKYSGAISIITGLEKEEVELSLQEKELPKYNIITKPINFKKLLGFIQSSK